MKKILAVLMTVLMISICGCSNDVKKPYLPEAENDKMFITTESKQHKGDGYTINISDKIYRYEQDYEDGFLEESWERKNSDDVKIRVTSYKNTDEITARGVFLRENDDYIFEDLMGYSVCGMEADGDTLWFNLHISEKDVYIVSWEYPENAKESIKKELSHIAHTFELSK